VSFVHDILKDTSNFEKVSRIKKGLPAIICGLIQDVKY